MKNNEKERESNKKMMIQAESNKDEANYLLAEYFGFILPH